MRRPKHIILLVEEGNLRSDSFFLGQVYNPDRFTTDEGVLHANVAFPGALTVTVTSNVGACMESLPLTGLLAGVVLAASCSTSHEPRERRTRWHYDRMYAVALGSYIRFV